MADIKSAREIAMEKMEKLGDPTEEERLQWKFGPIGMALAARYLKEDCNLVAELSQYQENEKRYVVNGAGEVLLRNISLPKNDDVRRQNKKMMDGFKLLKSDKTGVENIYSRLRQIFNHYLEQGDQQRRQAHDQLKTQFEAKLQQAMQQQIGTASRMRVDVERQPQFQEEWRKLQAQLDAPYLQHFDELRHELLSLS